MALKIQEQLNTRPIPGENFTSDTRNYPWHRPPEKDDFDDAMDEVFKRLTKPTSTIGLIERIELGYTVADIAGVFVMQGVGRGLWTVDQALLIAGPVTRLIEIILKSADVEYDLGLPSKYGEGAERMFTMFEPDAEDSMDDPVEAEPADIEDMSGGFMAPIDDLEDTAGDILEEMTVDEDDGEEI